MTLLAPGPTVTRRGLLCAGALLAAQTACAQKNPRGGGVETGYPSLSGPGGPPATLLERLAFWRVPGVSIAVFDRTGLLWAKGYGLADQASGGPVTTDTLFQAASNSKPVAAVAAMRMAAAGQLPLDEDINLYLRGWKVPDSPFTSRQKVTVRRILPHTDGLTLSGFGGHLAGAPLPTLTQMLNGEPPAVNGAVRSILTPGERYEYSNAGYTAMQLLMEETSGEPFEALMRRLVFEPTGMTSSTFDQALTPALRPRAALACDAFGAPLAGGWRLYPMQAAAGLWTTPSDLVRFVLAMQRAYDGTPSALSTVAMAREMIAPQPGAPEWGLGFQLAQSPGGPAMTHSGSTLGFKSMWLILRKTGQGAVVMTNGQNGARVLTEIFQALAASQGWYTPPRGLNFYALTPQAARPYEGVYQGQGAATCEIAADGGQLAFRRSGQPPALFFAASRTRFAAPGVPAIADFRMAKGEVTGMTMTINDRVVFDGRKEAR